MSAEDERSDTLPGGSLLNPPKNGVDNEASILEQAPQVLLGSESDSAAL